MRTLKFKVNPDILSPQKFRTIIDELQNIGDYNLQTGEFIYDDTKPEVTSKLISILDTNLLNANNE